MVTWRDRRIHNESIQLRASVCRSRLREAYSDEACSIAAGKNRCDCLLTRVLPQDGRSAAAPDLGLPAILNAGSEGSERSPHDRSHRTTSKAIADDLTADRANDHLFGSADIYTNYGSLEKHNLKLLYA